MDVFDIDAARLLNENHELRVASCDVIGDRRQEHSANNTMHPKTFEGW